MKTYPIPQEVADIMVKSYALNNLRDTYAKLPFGFKKAARAAIEAEKFRVEFWNKVYKIYPKIVDENKRMGHAEGSCEVYEVEADHANT